MAAVSVFLLFDKLGLSTMTLPKKFAIVALNDVFISGQNPHKCVPKTWLKFGNSDDVMFPYPTVEELPLSMDVIINYAPPLLRWPSHTATFICELDTYEEGLILITHLDDNIPEEYAIMTWKKLSREFKERQICQQPTSVLYQLWQWFLKFFYH